MSLTRTLTVATWCTTAVLAGALVVSTYAPMLQAVTPGPHVAPMVANCMAQFPDGACSDRPYIQGAPSSQVNLPPCRTEDDSECYWNGYTMGNHMGRSYVYTGHRVYYTDGTVEFPECTDDGDWCADTLGY